MGEAERVHGYREVREAAEKGAAGGWVVKYELGAGHAEDFAKVDWPLADVLSDLAHNGWTGVRLWWLADGGMEIDCSAGLLASIRPRTEVG